MKIDQTITLNRSDWINADFGVECRCILHARSTTSERVAWWMPWALKVYRSAAVAIEARERQVKFWHKGLAPEVGELVRVRVRGIKRAFFGYFTEQVEGKIVDDYMPVPFKDLKDMPADFHHARRRLAAMGYNDFHEGNMMFCTRRLRWLAIDFGPCSNQTPKATTREAAA